MEEGAAALRKRPRQTSARGGPALNLRRSKAPHHRRRRAVAIGLAGLVVLLIAVVAGFGGTSHHSTGAHRPAGLLARIDTLAGTGAGSLVVAQQAAEFGAIDRTLAYTPYVRIAGAQHREVALTFDDGPGPYTPAILSELESARVPATFFEVGVLEQYFHASTERIIGDGDVIGDHTENHAPMGRLAPAAQQAQLLQQTSAIGNYGASFPRLFRPPYGLWNQTTLNLLHRYRMLMVLWTVDTADFRQPGVAAIVNSAIKGARPGAIILLHDAGGNRADTVAAVPLIIRALRARHYRLVTVPRLLLDNPPSPNQNISAVIGSGG
jgi:peptidoglycan-N-acetylglucosamine deacetylase